MGKKLQLGALLAIMAFAAGCAPAYHITEQQIADLRTRVDSMEQAPPPADTSGAEQMAAQAQATAEEALAAANAVQAAVDATNERLDRMFEAEQAK
jgi:hypothetical protein